MMSLILLQAGQQVQYIHGTWGWILGIGAFAGFGVGIYFTIKFISRPKN